MAMLRQVRYDEDPRATVAKPLAAHIAQSRQPRAVSSCRVVQCRCEAEPLHLSQALAALASHKKILTMQNDKMTAKLLQLVQSTWMLLRLASCTSLNAHGD